MIVKWFKYGTGDGTSAFNYLLNDRVQQGTAKVLRGNPSITKSIIKSLKTKRTYKSGCLSFSENDISAKIQNEIMDLFEQTIFPGIPPENRNICWILHTDKKDNRIELNYVIPRVELQSGYSFQPYFDRVDRKRFEAFRNYVNQKYSLSNPNDPNRAQTIKLGDLIKYKKVEHIKKLDTYLQTQVSKGRLKNQEDVIAELKNVGYSVSRVGKDYISVKTSNDSKAIRLRGKIYSKDWEEPEQVKKISTHDLYSKLQIEILKAKKYNENKFYGGLQLCEDLKFEKENFAPTKKKNFEL